VGRWAAVAALAALVLLADQLTKHWAATLPFNGMPLVGDWCKFQVVHNPGALFGWLPVSTTALVVVAIVFLGVIIAYAPGVWRSRLLTVALALILGGGVGNLSDRIRLGYVVDFVQVGRWPVFNLADSALTVGALLVIWSWWREQ